MNKYLRELKELIKRKASLMEFDNLLERASLDNSISNDEYTKLMKLAQNEFKI